MKIDRIGQSAAKTCIGLERMFNLEEVWKKISDYDYEVSNLGNVRSMDKVLTAKTGRITNKKGKMISKTKDCNGYYYVDLWKDNKRKRMKVHRLVAMAFIENNDAETKTIVNHIDGCKENNRVDNLEWATYSENTIHATEHGLNQIETIVQHSLESRVKLYRYDLQGKLIAEYESAAHACLDLGLSKKSGSYLTRQVMDSGKVYKNSKWYSKKIN